MKKIIIFILLFFIITIYGQTETKESLFELTFPKYIEFLGTPNHEIVSDTILTEIDSLNNQKYGKYCFKKVDNQTNYIQNNKSNLKSYFWTDYSEVELENNELLITYNIGTFIKYKEKFFKKKVILEYSVYDGRKSISFIYKFDSKLKKWNYQGRLR